MSRQGGKGVRYLTVGSALLLSLGLLLWGVALATRHQALRDLLNGGGQRLNLYVAGLQGELDKFRFLPRILAENEAVNALLAGPDDAALTIRANRYLHRFNAIAGGSASYVMDRDGLTLASSNWDQPLTFVGKNFAFRPYFRDALAGEPGRYFALGSTSKLRGFYFSYPVKRGGEVIGVTVVKVSIERLEEMIERDGQPVIVTDLDGVIFLSNRPMWRYRTLRPLSPERRQRLKESRRYGDASLDPLPIDDERPYTGASLIRVGATRKPPSAEYVKQTARLPFGDWIVHVLTDLRPVKARVYTAVALAGFLFATLAVLGALFRQRRLHILDRLAYQTELQKATEARERHAQALVDSTQAGLVTTDLEGRILSLNPTAEALFGFESELVQGRQLSHLLDEGDAQRVQEFVLQSCDVPAARSMEVLGRRADGTRFTLDLSVHPLPLLDVHELLVTVVDISERKHSEQALRRAHEQLEQRVQERTQDLSDANLRLREEISERERAEQGLRQAQDELIQAAKLAVLGRMAAGVTHELNQPLAAIRSYADNARVFMERNCFAEAIGNLEQIAALTERMAEVGRQLKTFARKSEGKAEAIDPAGVINNSLALLNSRIRRQECRVTLNICDDLMVSVDAIRLEQVLVNLIGNALDALEQAERPAIEIAIMRDGEVCRIAVKDNGPGIDEENLGQIFDPFFTTKEVGEGLGLGLSISYGIVQGFGGRLRAGNRKGGGAEFTLELPVYDQTSERVA